MQTNMSNQKYWLIAGLVFIALIMMLYPFGTYDTPKLEITRPEAIKIAKDYLK